MHSSVFSADIPIFQKDFERFQLSDISQHFCKCCWKADPEFSEVIQVCSVDEPPILQKISFV